jgi:hypothetical protein
MLYKTLHPSDLQQFRCDRDYRDWLQRAHRNGCTIDDLAHWTRLLFAAAHEMQTGSFPRFVKPPRPTPTRGLR